MTFFRLMQAQNPGAMLRSTLGVLFGGLITLMFLWGVRNQAAERHWPQVVGRVTSCSKSAEGGHSSDYNLDLDYDYTVAGQDYSGKDSSTISGSSEKIDQLITQTPAGTQIDIRYNPANPSDSVLAAFVSKNMAGDLFLWLGPIALIASLISLVQVARATRNAPVQSAGEAASPGP